MGTITAAKHSRSNAPRASGRSVKSRKPSISSSRRPPPADFSSSAAMRCVTAAASAGQSTAPGQLVSCCFKRAMLGFAASQSAGSGGVKASGCQCSSADMTLQTVAAGCAPSTSASLHRPAFRERCRHVSSLRTERIEGGRTVGKERSCPKRCSRRLPPRAARIGEAVAAGGARPRRLPAGARPQEVSASVGEGSVQAAVDGPRTTLLRA